MSNNNFTDNQLISQIKSGSDEAMKTLLSRYTKTFSFFVDKYSAYGLENDDLLQEAQIAFWAAIRVYEESLSQFSTFVSVCIERAMIKLLRTSLRKSNIPAGMIMPLEDISLPSNDNPELTVIEEENFRVLFNKLKSDLSKLEFKVLFSYISTGSYKETAVELNISEKSVSNSLARARSKISQLTGNC